MEVRLEELVSKVAVIGIAGLGAQWLAWRYRVPAIVLLAMAGFLLGPVTDFVNPERDFGSVLRPFIAVAVAIILFEGGLTLNFREISQTSKAVRRLALIGAPLGWLLGALAGRYIAGLPWPAAVVLGGILVVTGPTVIMPLLRQAKLAQRPASLLRWEAIVNDPVGALFAVLAFEAFVIAKNGGEPQDLAVRATVALIVALAGGFLTGRGLVAAFNRGAVPEYLKAPILIVVVLAAYAISQSVLEESGLLTVTVMGLTIGNSRLASLGEIKRFKEVITVLLVSGVFVLLTATVDASVMGAIDWRAAAFMLAMLFLVRPLTTWTATIGSGLTWQERTLIGWIAPRGVVAIAVASFFAVAMESNYLDGGRKMTALAFLMVITTVILHGFTLAPVARALGLSSYENRGILIVGGTAWSTALAEKLKELKVPVMIADSNWTDLRAARAVGIPTYYGEILSETAEHIVDFNAYGTLLAATSNDAYNTLVCSNFAYEFGRENVFQLPLIDRKSSESGQINIGLGGRPLLGAEASYFALEGAMARGARFTATKLTEKFDLTSFAATDGGARTPVLAIRADRRLTMSSSDQPLAAGKDDTIIGFG